MLKWTAIILGIIVVLLICGVVYWAITQLLPLIPLPEPFARIIHVLMVIILVLLGAAGVHVPGPFRTTGLLGGTLAASAAAAA